MYVSMNKFSIVVAVYNNDKYIKRCINSILRQSYNNIELIIIDDGSTDNSYSEANEFAKKDSRVKLIKQANQGVSSARNTGIQNATGDYITFVDSDDWLENNAIEVLNNGMQTECEMVIAEIANIINNKKTYIPCKTAGKYTIKELFYKLLKYPNYIERINSVCAKVYKLEIIKNKDIYFNKDLQIGEDLLFNIEYLKNVNNITWIQDALYNYYIDNNTSCTKQYISNKYEQLSLVNEEFRKLLINFKDKKLLKIAKYIKLKNIYSCIFDLYHLNCKINSKEKIRYLEEIKTKNKKIILHNMEIKLYILSILYTYLPPKIFLYLCKIIRKTRNKPQKVFIRAYLRKNLGDDLFVKILSERYPNTQFKTVSNYKYKNVFNENVKVYGGRIYNLLNKSIQLITLKRYSLVKLFIDLNEIIVWIGGSIFMENGLGAISSIMATKKRE